MPEQGDGRRSLDPNTSVAVRFERRVEISTLGFGLSKCGVLLGRHIEVVIDMAAPKLDFQNPLVSFIAHAGDDSRLDRLSRPFQGSPNDMLRGKLALRGAALNTISGWLIFPL